MDYGNASNHIDHDDDWTWTAWMQYVASLIPSMTLYFPRTWTHLSPVTLPNGKCIYISDAPSAADEHLLQQHDITSMVTIRTSYALFSPVYNHIDQLPEDTVEKLYIHMNDFSFSNLFEHLEPVVKFIDQCLTDERNV